jgi:hypothetical protein
METVNLASDDNNVSVVNETTDADKEPPSPATPPPNSTTIRRPYAVHPPWAPRKVNNRPPLSVRSPLSDFQLSDAN